MGHISPDLGSYSDSAYGLVRRVFTVPITKDDVKTAGTLAETYITVPKKSKLVRFGVMSAASDVVMATNDGFELRTNNGTEVATWAADADYTLATGHATGATPETATCLVKNKSYMCCVSTNTGLSGSIYYFVDVVDDLDPETGDTI